MKIVKTIITYFIFFVLIFSSGINLWANNIQISNVQIIEKNSVEHWANIRFDLSYDNAWRINTGASNWCAAWIFVKYRLADGIWRHATLNTVDSLHIMPANITGDATSDGKGLFIYDSRVNAGNFDFVASGVIIRWNYGIDGISDSESDVDIKLFGIEMVYVPTGNFSLGTMGSENNSFYAYTAPGIYLPYLVLSENQINIGTNLLNLNYKTDVTYAGDGLGQINAAFPKGYGKFYLMRYEISQQQYVDFLNSLTRTQQSSRVESNISGTNINNNFVMSGTSNMVNRNSIACAKTGNGTTNPVNFFCDFNGNGVGNELNDGQNIACGYLNWADGLAYLDWAGLRPMTELEFEKACRGNQSPLADEYTWGTTTTLRVSGITNPGATSEISSNAGNGLSNFDDLEVGIGPLRCGFAATASTDRVQSAASFYGVSNLSDNLSERCITVGSISGRAFTGLNGDGILNNSGIANVANWPDFNGQSVRGGNYLRKRYRMCVSERSFGAYDVDDRFDNVGWRGARTAE